MYESTADRLCSQVSDVFTLIDFYESKDKSYTDKTLIDIFDQLIDCLVKMPPSDANWSAVDKAILANFREEAASPSDLRYVIVNLVGILFKYYCRVAAPYDKNYHAIREWRGGKRDANFIQEDLLDILLTDRSRSLSYTLRKYFVHIAANFMNRFGGQNPLFDNISLSEVSLIPHEVQLFSLYRRYVDDSNRMQDESSFEAVAHKTTYFNELSRFSKFGRKLLQEMEYLKHESFLSRVFAFIKTAFSHALPLFINGRYLAYHLRSRKTVYLLFLLWVVIVGCLTYGHMMYWKFSNHELYQQMRDLVSGR